MPDALTTITKLINSPPGVVVAGGVLAGIVWKFFERVESVLTDQTKLEIAVWLVGVKPLGPKVEPWPGTFAKVFDRVFGVRHFSWRCLGRSAIASLLIGFTGFVLAGSLLRGFSAKAPLLGRVWETVLSIVQGDLRFRFPGGIWVGLVILIFATNILPDYLSLLETRFVLRLMQKSSSVSIAGLLLLDGVLTLGTAIVWNMALFKLLKTGNEGTSSGALSTLIRPWPGLWFVYPAFFTSIWLWLYAGSGFILKAAQRFDVSFGWFISKADIEKKPLQSIGLVAGALVAVVYWAAVLVGRWV